MQTMPKTSAESHFLKALTIAVVDRRFDDYADLQNDMREDFICWRIVSTGNDALHLSRIQPVDLWMINIQLPDMSGLDLCSMLKSQLDSVIYMVTDSYDEKQERDSRIRGAAMFECKPPQAKWIDRLLFMRNKYSRNFICDKKAPIKADFGVRRK
jgi:response regulator RpfG family c-di-GMP phosphodiesterase